MELRYSLFELPHVKRTIPNTSKYEVPVPEHRNLCPVFQNTVNIHVGSADHEVHMLHRIV